MAPLPGAAFETLPPAKLALQSKTASRPRLRSTNEPDNWAQSPAGTRQDVAEDKPSRSQPRQEAGFMAVCKDDAFWDGLYAIPLAQHTSEAPAAITDIDTVQQGSTGTSARAVWMSRPGEVTSHTVADRKAPVTSFARMAVL